MFAPTVYIPRAEPALPDGWSLTGPQPDEFLGLSPSQLKDERGRYQILLIDAVTEHDAAFYQHKLDHIDRRIERYRTHLTVKIRWPDRDRSNDLVRLAQGLKRAVPLERFISDQVLTTRLQRAGDRWRGTCPLHEERTPSFIVYPDSGWTCFGKCNRSGDIYTLIGLVFGLELFRDQVALLANYYGREMA